MGLLHCIGLIYFYLQRSVWLNVMESGLLTAGITNDRKISMQTFWIVNTPREYITGNRYGNAIEDEKVIFQKLFEISRFQSILLFEHILISLSTTTSIWKCHEHWLFRLRFVGCDFWSHTNYFIGSQLVIGIAAVKKFQNLAELLFANRNCLQNQNFNLKQSERRSHTSNRKCVKR